MSDSSELYINEETLPQLVLGIELRPEDDRHFVFKEPERWKIIQHQTGGVACMQRRILGWRLPIRPEKLGQVKELCDHWEDSDMCRGLVGLDGVLSYREDLKKLLGVDCNQCFEKFEEAWYPVDPGFINTLTEESISSFDYLIDWQQSRTPMYQGFLSRWSLVILGVNSD